LTKIGKKRAEAQVEIGAEEAIFIQTSISKSANLTIELQNADRWSGQ
jgi:hypothetical protein